jgi:hypothetical protein
MLVLLLLGSISGQDSTISMGKEPNGLIVSLEKVAPAPAPTASAPYWTRVVI